MDTCVHTECEQIDALTMLQNEAMEQGVSTLSDEVEELRNSLREIVQDQAVRPKLQCLMMDHSFSMVTVQSEDSGIIWETASSRCSTPWASEASTAASESCYSLAEQTATPGSGMAGKVIFIMDENMIVRRKKKKKRSKAGERQSRLAATAKELLEEADRPAMVEVSLPNVKGDGVGEEAEATADPKEEKRQRLFRLVSEGSEILNIIAPPKVSTVDEEESTALADNLSYLEETPVFKTSGKTEEAELSAVNLEMVTAGEIGAGKDEEKNPKDSEEKDLKHSQDKGSPDKPGRKGAISDLDYFEKFTLLDEHAPGGLPPATEELEPESASEERDVTAVKGKRSSTDAKLASEGLGDSAAIGFVEITSELLDEVFYGGGGDPDRVEGCKAGSDLELQKSPLKESGSSLFGSQESILTPIFLSPGPPKIIDPILLEEPTAMAFMYTDLYEEAMGSRKREEDAESITSEKSFHSKESDIEDRGYLEKFVLKDETPVVDIDPTTEVCKKDGLRTWSQDTFELASSLSPPEQEEQGEVKDHVEITDFFRNSANSSPCEVIEPVLAETEEATAVLKSRRVAFEHDVTKEDRKSPQTEQEVSQPPSKDDGKPPEDENAMGGKLTVQDEIQHCNISKHLPIEKAGKDNVSKKLAITENADKGVSAQHYSSTTPTEEAQPGPSPQTDSEHHRTPLETPKTEKTATKNPHNKAAARIQQGQSRGVQPTTTPHKPFLGLTLLMPAETQEEKEGEEERKGKEGDGEGEGKIEGKQSEDEGDVALKNIGLSSPEKAQEAMPSDPEPQGFVDGEEELADTLDFELITQQEASECPPPETDSTEGRGGESAEECSDTGGFAIVEPPSQKDFPSEDTVETGFEIV